MPVPRDDAAFRALADAHRPELQVHCYRILGSVQDAEDLVQETLLAAWRGLDAFEARASVRTWLYRIATNRCLNALRDRGRRVLELLTSDAWLTMPPEPLEYQGPAAIAGFLSTVPAGGRLDQFRLVATRANGQPAFGCYLRDAHAPVAHAYGLMALTLRGDRVAAITGFPDTSVFPHFGLPRTLRFG